MRTFFSHLAGPSSSPPPQSYLTPHLNPTPHVAGCPIEQIPEDHGEVKNFLNLTQACTLTQPSSQALSARMDTIMPAPFAPPGAACRPHHG